MGNVDDLEIRPVTEDEYVEWGRTVERAFGEDPSEERLGRFRPLYDDLSRTMAAFAGDRIVGTNADFAFDMSVPGGDPVPCAGVTAVSVATDWRRRGVLRRMMREQLVRVHEEHQEPFAALYASESPIYGRFGYGTAAPHIHYKIGRHHAELAVDADVRSVRLIDAPTALEVYPVLYDAARSTRGGMMSRSETWWRGVLEHDDPEDRDGWSPRSLALTPDRGYAFYRTKSDWDMQGAKGKLRVEQLVATDPETAAALWQFLFGVDLVGEIVAWMRPVDDPLPSLLNYRGRLQENRREGLWLRLVDVGAALVTRRYDAPGQLTLEVRDSFCDWNQGKWSLEVDDDGQAACERSDRQPDLELGVDALAGLFLGGLAPHQLADAGRIDERRDGALSAARRMFATDHAPWNPFEF
ncbi:MAG: GNAT family N-acetyltransferase [Nitriliruptorales bacterium]|nr:GNAT family N-acetyltransferase [Nitriliruptorales bacterium]